jgi:serine/threonine-protein kinase RsbW
MISLQFSIATFFIGLLLLILVATFLARKNYYRLNVPSRHSSIRTVIDHFARLAESSGWTKGEIYKCRLALDEACVNIINHAYAGNPDQRIEIVMDISPHAARFTLIDFGHAYDPDDVPAPTLDKQIDHVQPGGLGLYLMRKMMDEVSYTAGPNRNALVMFKHREK